MINGNTMPVEDIGIIGWQKNSFIDFPRTVSTVLFFRGCNLRCPYCHNPDIVFNRLPPVSLNGILSFLDQRAGLIEGVVLTGGEPTLHKRLPDVISVLRDKGLKIKLDTNGLLPEMITLCKPDYLAMDLKTDPAQYVRLGGEYNDIPDRIFQSIEIVKSMGDNAEIRITASPAFIDNNTINTIADLVTGVSKIYLQQTVTNNNLLDKAYADVDPYPVSVLEKFKSLLLEKVKQCTIRGFD